MLQPSPTPPKDSLRSFHPEQSCVYTNDELAIESAPQNNSPSEHLDQSILLSSSLSSDQQKSPWTFEEEQLLFQLHNQLGNKWSLIAQHFPSKQKSDNCVKNHFYSRLRKALRKLNKIIFSEYKKQIKEIKHNVIYKIIEVTQFKHKKNQSDTAIALENRQYIRVCQDLKNRLLAYSYDNIQTDQARALNMAKQLIEEILIFIKQQRKNSKKPQSLSDEDTKKKSKKSSLMRETKNFASLLHTFSSIEHIDESSASPNHVTTRNWTRSREMRDERQKSESMNVTPSKTQSSSQFKEKADDFLKETGLMDDYFLAPESFVAKRQSSVEQKFERISLQLVQLELFDQENESKFGLRSLDHFEDPELDEGKFSMFE